jgi:hypothetical protein
MSEPLVAVVMAGSFGAAAGSDKRRRSRQTLKEQTCTGMIARVHELVGARWSRIDPLPSYFTTGSAIASRLAWLCTPASTRFRSATGSGPYQSPDSGK